MEFLRLYKFIEWIKFAPETNNNKAYLKETGTKLYIKQKILKKSSMYIVQHFRGYTRELKRKFIFNF